MTDFDDDFIELEVGALGDPDTFDVRADALEVLLNRQTSAKDWLQSESRIHDLLSSTEDRPERRSKIVELAAMAPLESVRTRVRQIAADDNDPAARTARLSLALLGDRQCVDQLIHAIDEQLSDPEVARTLAQSPLETLDVDPDTIASAIGKLDESDPTQSTVYLWLALALARLGKLDYLGRALDKLDAGWTPGVLFGNPSDFESDIRAMSPVPSQLTEFLRSRMSDRRTSQPGPSEGAVEPDSLPGRIYHSLTEEPGSSTAPPARKEDVAETLRRFVLPGNVTLALPEDDSAESSLAELTATAFDESLTALASDDRRQDAPPEIVLGNEFISLVDSLPKYVPDSHAIARSYLDYVGKTGSRSSNFEAQIGWLLSRGGFDTMLAGISQYLKAEDERTREIAWSLTKSAARFAVGYAMPYCGAGVAATGTEHLYRTARLKDLIGQPKVAAKGDAGADFETEPNFDFDIDIEAAPDFDADTEADFGTETEPDFDADTGADFDIETEPDFGTDADADIAIAPPSRPRAAAFGEPANPAPSESLRGGDTQEELEELPPDDSDEEDPPRSAYGLVKAPDTVRPMKAFTVTVGLSDKQTPGTTGGKLTRPLSSRGTYWLKIRLTCDGFRIQSDSGAEVFLEVSSRNPYPTEELELVALDDEEFSDSRIILAEFSVDGQMLGAAARQIAIDDSLAEDSSDAVASGVSVVVDAHTPPADITMTISRGNDKNGYRWKFSVDSPHGEIDMTPPADPEALVARFESTSEEFARQLLIRVETREGSDDLREIIADAGERIAAQIPLWVQKKLIEVYEHVQNRPPTLLIISAEPHVPWELAYLPLKEEGKQFLSMEFVVGRWVLGTINPRTEQPEPPIPPPPSVEVKRMTVISGDYSNTKGFKKLPGAEAEAERLSSTYVTTALNASMDKLLPWLRSNPDAQLIHFSVHGKWGNTGIKDGIGLVDGKMLDPSVVRQSKLVGHPFIFLNACQVGQGQTVLGDYGGMAEAFLKAGAAAVVAPLWSVDDESANAVAERFYAAIDSGKNPGELVRRERLNFVAHPTSATSLAYQFFGHPAMRMALNVERRSNSQ